MTQRQAIRLETLMKHKLSLSNTEEPTPNSSEKLTMEELCKQRGIPYKNTTAEHVGESPVHFSTWQRSGPKKPDLPKRVGLKSGLRAWVRADD
jgi:hypothetical protein